MRVRTAHRPHRSVGQRHATIRIANLHYEGTVETAVYGVLRDRIGLFELVVGPTSQNKPNTN